jgi:hypothetical protein
MRDRVERPQQLPRLGATSFDEFIAKPQAFETVKVDALVTGNRVRPLPNGGKTVYLAVCHRPTGGKL